MGVNDGGKYVTKRKERQEMFVKYITRRKDVSYSSSDDGDNNTFATTIIASVIMADAPDLNGEHRASNDQATEKIGYPHSKQDVTQKGLYKVIDRRFGVDGPLVRFILLDTRSHRDNHYIRSLGEIKLPLTPLIAAFIRAAYSVLGFGREHRGTSLTFINPTARLFCSTSSMERCISAIF